MKTALLILLPIAWIASWTGIMLSLASGQAPVKAVPPELVAAVER
ncbi:hypothetical protein [Luteolibacter soli]|uniref:Uncharacterized protein n=1 Tax=Luteolibacter soli TaxID=3135280 RepID=A0ABU9AW96_9BACT